MYISVSTFLSHGRTKPGTKYQYDPPSATNEFNSKYGKTTTLGFNQYLKVTKELLLIPNQAYSFPQYNQGNLMANGKPRYTRATANIEKWEGGLSYDFDELSSMVPIEALCDRLDKENIEYYAMFSQNHTTAHPKVKFLLNTGLSLSKEDILKYTPLYLAVARMYSISQKMDKSTVDASRLMAPFNDPYKQDKPSMYRSNTPSNPSALTIDVGAISPVEEYGTNQSQLIETSTLNYPKFSKDIREATDLDTNLLYGIDVTVNGIRDKLPLAQVLSMASEGRQFQVACACPSIHQSATGDSNIGYGVLTDRGDYNYTLTCGGNHPTGEKVRRLSLFSDRALLPEEATRTDKYLRVDNSMVVNVHTGKFHIISQELLASKELEVFTQGFVDMSEVTRLCTHLYYYPGGNTFRLIGGLNKTDRLTEQNLLAVAEVDLSLTILKAPKVDKEGNSEGYPFSVPGFSQALIHFLKAKAYRIEKTVYKVSNSYKREEKLEGTILTEYMPFNPITVLHKPDNAAKAFAHFIIKHKYLTTMLRNAAIEAYKEPNSRTGLRFWLLFGTGGIGKGIISAALVDCGAGTTMSNASVKAIGSSGDVKIAESPEDLSRHMFALVTDTKTPKDLLSNSKMMTDTFMARNNYKDGVEVTVLSLGISAADNISPKDFITGVDAGQLLRRFKMPKIGRLNTALLMERPPKYISPKDWVEGSRQFEEYIEGVRWGISYILERAVSMAGRLKTRDYKELIDREMAMANKATLIPSLLLAMMSDLVLRMEPRLTMGPNIDGDKQQLTLSAQAPFNEMPEVSHKHFSLSTGGKLGLNNSGFKYYADVLDGGAMGSAGYPYRTQLQYLDELTEAVSSKSGHTTATVLYDTTKKSTYYKYLPFDARVYAQVIYGHEHEDMRDSNYNMLKDSGNFDLASDDIHPKLVELLNNREVKFSDKTVGISLLLAAYHISLDREGSKVEVEVPVVVGATIKDLL